MARKASEQLSGVKLKGFARQVITLARQAGLDPHLRPDGQP